MKSIYALAVSLIAFSSLAHAEGQFNKEEYAKQIKSYTLSALTTQSGLQVGYMIASCGMAATMVVVDSVKQSREFNDVKSELEKVTEPNTNCSQTTDKLLVLLAELKNRNARAFNAFVTEINKGE